MVLVVVVPVVVPVAAAAAAAAAVLGVILQQFVCFAVPGPTSIRRPRPSSSAVFPSFLCSCCFGYNGHEPSLLDRIGMV